jgi:DNA-binding transcriptional regulator YhcF (GntR family)
MDAVEKVKNRRIKETLAEKVTELVRDAKKLGISEETLLRSVREQYETI